MAALGVVPFGCHAAMCSTVGLIVIKTFPHMRSRAQGVLYKTGPPIVSRSFSLANNNIASVHDRTGPLGVDYRLAYWTVSQ